MFWYFTNKKNITGNLTTTIRDKRNDTNFSIVNFPYLCSNIPSSLSYSDLSEGHALRTCMNTSYLKRGKLLTKNTRISTVSICFIFKQHDWPSKEQLYIFKSHVKHCAKIVHFLTIMLLKNSVYFVKKTLLFS